MGNRSAIANMTFDEINQGRANYAEDIVKDIAHTTHQFKKQRLFAVIGGLMASAAPLFSNHQSDPNLYKAGVTLLSGIAVLVASGCLAAELRARVSRLEAVRAGNYEALYVAQPKSSTSPQH